MAYLEDYAYLCDALIDCYEAAAGESFITRAHDLALRMVSEFHDPESGGFFHTAHGHEALIVRKLEAADHAIPSANAVAARALLRLSWHFGVDRFRELALGAIHAHGRLVERAPRAFVSSLMVVDMLLEEPALVVVAGARDDERTAALRRELGTVFLPNRAIVHLVPGTSSHAPAQLVAGKSASAPTLYACRAFACKAPVTDPLAVRAALEADGGEALSRRAERTVA
jgi:uncharacterized protein YyaL (SSP411 family)